MIMSIAVSALVRPSICARALLAGFSLLATGMGVFLGSGLGGTYLWSLAGAGISVGAGLMLTFSLFKNRNALRIDISGVGQIRMTVYQVMRSKASGASDDADVQGVPVSLMAGSTLWPGLLLLRLRDADGRVTVLPVWPDSVGAMLFRPLAVACRAIAARTDGQN